MASSDDGLNWVSRPSGVNVRCQTVTFAGDTFVVGGDNGVMIQSAGLASPFLNLHSHPGPPGYDLTVTGLIGRHYRVQRSTNLVDWLDWQVFDCTGPSTNWTDALGPQRMFYRVISP